MQKSSSLVVVEEDEKRNAIVLTLASPAQNSVVQLYPERVQVSCRSIDELDKKLSEKLRLHSINQVNSHFSIKFENDRTQNIDSIEKFCALDSSIAHLTNVVTARWSFVFAAAGEGSEHVHSVLVRISERPNPGILLQRFISGRTEDIDSLDGEAFATVSCKVDFLEGRFSTELLALVSEWVNALPKAEPTFGIFKWLRNNIDEVQSFIQGTFPPLVMLAALGLWMAFLPAWITSSVRIAVGWIVLSGVIFLLSRYFASFINKILGKNIARICNVPVFQITAGDKNKMTEYLAKSHQSAIKIAAGGFVYGSFKALALYMVTRLMTRLFS